MGKVVRERAIFYMNCRKKRNYLIDLKKIKNFEKTY